ncbi:hypothetical protein RM530_03995 [Algiphilus sp. W345]|uniref:DUF7210 domain-containing protein n=1 Tax=Banduia mediterranea TaxID=3075609 RepID=A0ABU2WHH4_9GAMM|nr:hypothetical protein [Algiphilus sp. W345]MDT0496527.1 hypothetical protein [Algiphilus sp. W345]
MPRKPTTGPDPIAPEIGDTPGDYGAPPPFDSELERSAEPARVAVVLRTPHNHAGVQYGAGKTIEVSPQIADWLRQRGVI